MFVKFHCGAMMRNPRIGLDRSGPAVQGRPSELSVRYPAEGRVLFQPETSKKNVCASQNVAANETVGNSKSKEPPQHCLGPLVLATDSLPSGAAGGGGVIPLGFRPAAF